MAPFKVITLLTFSAIYCFGLTSENTGVVLLEKTADQLQLQQQTIFDNLQKVKDNLSTYKDKNLESSVTALDQSIQAGKVLNSQFRELLNGYKLSETIWSEREHNYESEQLNSIDRLSVLQRRLNIVMQENDRLMEKVKTMFTANTILKESQDRLYKLAKKAGVSTSELSNATNLLSELTNIDSSVITTGMTQQLEQANLLIESLRATNNKLELQLKDTQTQLAKLQPMREDAILNSQELVMQYSKTVERQTALIEQLQNELSTSKRNYDSNLATEIARTTKLQQDLELNKTTVTNNSQLTIQLNDINVKYNNLLGSLESKDKLIKDLQTQLSNQTIQINTLTANNGELVKVSKQITKLTKDLEDTTNLLHTKDLKLNSLKQKLKVKTKTKAETNSQIASLNMDVDLLKKQEVKLITELESKKQELLINTLLLEKTNKSLLTQKYYYDRLLQVKDLEIQLLKEEARAKLIAK